MLKKYMVILRRSLQFYISCQIPLKYFKSVKFPHPIGIVISSGVLIHENVVIYQNVTIGRSTINNETAYPIIEKDVIIYAGAVIIGSIRVGEGSVIGANAVVSKSVTPNSVVFGYNKIKTKDNRN